MRRLRLAIGMMAVTGAALGADVTLPEVRVDSAESFTRMDVTLPGRLVSWAVAADGSGGSHLVYLVSPLGVREEAKKDETALPPCPEDGGKARALYLLDPVSRDRLLPLLDDVPHDATAVDAADLDGDGRDELLIARNGELLAVELSGDTVVSASPPRSVVDDPGLRWRSLDPRPVRQPILAGAARVTSTRLGSLRVYGPGADGGAWQRQAEVELPIGGEIHHGGLRVRSAVPRLIGIDGEGTLILATPPETYGDLRVRTTLITAGPGGETTSTDCWARLPEPEDVLDDTFLVIDDQPLLMVLTTPADRLNLFGEQRMRLYALRRDRSRLGILPLYTNKSRMNLWQEGHPLLLDVNGDGRDDLILGYWKGLMSSRVVLDVYLRVEDGWFEEQPRTTAFDVKKGDDSYLAFGNDLDGDDAPDLLIRNEQGVLLLYPGRPSRDGKQLVDKRRVLSLPSGALSSYFTWQHRPRTIDVDGDGVHEIVLIDTAGGLRPSLFRVFWPVRAE